MLLWLMASKASVVGVVLITYIIQLTLYFVNLLVVSLLPFYVLTDLPQKHSSSANQCTCSLATLLAYEVWT